MLTRCHERVPVNERDLALSVARKEMVADSVVALDLVAADGASLPAWTAGAHIDITCGSLVRQYSLCGDPDNLFSYRIAVRREEDGRGGSRFLHDVVAEGDTLSGRGPRNNFALVEAKRYLFIAGGIGVTPLLPMLSAAEANEVEWRLEYGGRDRRSMPFRDELVSRYPGRVAVRPQDEEGLLDLDALLSEPNEGTAVYCCGPEALLQAAEIYANGWSETTLHVERFAPKQNATAGHDSPFEVEIASTGEVLQVPAGRSVLEVLDQAGVPVLSSCTEGTCGTCETGVLAGSVDHRDSLLTADEQQANDVMFVCVSRAHGERLVLDL